MRNFIFNATPTVFFGTGVFRKIKDILSDQGYRRVLLLTGARSFAGSDHWQLLQSLFQEAGAEFRHISVSGEPSPELIDAAAGEFRKNPPDAVLSIGGGSTIDAGKAVSAMLKADGPITSYLEGVGTEPAPGGKIPFIAVPTTSGTGSEATKNAVISRVGKDGFKKSLRHNDYIPDWAILDPELQADCPLEITAPSGMDAVTQLLEAYVSSGSNPVTDGYASIGLELAGTALPAVCGEGRRDLDARGRMALAAFNSGVSLANAGLGIVHGIAGAVGGMVPIPHGVACGTLLAPATEVITAKILTNRGEDDLYYQKYGTAAGFLTGKTGGAAGEKVNRLIELLWSWTDLFQLPNLGMYGIKLSDLPGIAGISGLKNTPISLTEDEIVTILEKRL